MIVKDPSGEARAFGATGVPFTVYGRRYATAGAQSIEGYREVLAQTVTAVEAGSAAS